MSKCECDCKDMNEKLDRILYALEPKKIKPNFNKEFDNTKDFDKYCATCGDPITMHNTGEPHPTKPGKFIWEARNKDGSEHDNGCKKTSPVFGDKLTT